MKTITWKEFTDLCKNVNVIFRNDDNDELVRAADEWGVDLAHTDTGVISHFTAELNQTIDVEENNIFLMSEHFATIISIYNITPYVFKPNV